MGRPKGSKNKPKDIQVVRDVSVGKMRGRPRKVISTTTDTVERSSDYQLMEFMEIDEDDTTTSSILMSDKWSSDDSSGFDRFSIGSDLMY